MKQLTRRKAVLGALGTGAAALAGCVSDSGDDTDNQNDDTADEQNDDEEMTTVESSIERVDSGCSGMGPGEVAVYLDDGEYIAQGTIPAPNPCHLPTIESDGFADGTLSLTVDTTKESDEACVECVGEVLYDATISGPDPDDVERVSVTHAGGKTHDTPAGEIPTGVPEVAEATVTESNPRPRDGETNGTAEVGELEDKAGTVTVTGTIPTNNPHYEAVVTDASVHNGTLSLSVEVESTLEDGRAGTMPLGVVEYTASVDIEPSAALDSVRIEHPKASYGSSWASDSAAADEGTTSDSDSQGSDR